MYDSVKFPLNKLNMIPSKSVHDFPSQLIKDDLFTSSIGFCLVRALVDDFDSYDSHTDLCMLM